MTHVLAPKMIIYQSYEAHKIALIMEVIFITGLTLCGLLSVFYVPPETQDICGRVLGLFFYAGMLSLFAFSSVEDCARKILGKAFFLLSLATATTMFVMIALLFPYLSCLPVIIAVISFKLLVILSMFFCGFEMGVSIYSFISNQDVPALVLDSAGVWTPHFGLIPWSNIAEVAPPSPTIGCINIKIFDFKALRAHATWEGKFYLFLLNLCKKFGFTPYYHISINYLDTPNDVIIAFAHQYMQGDIKN